MGQSFDGSTSAMKAVSPSSSSSCTTTDDVDVLSMNLVDDDQQSRQQQPSSPPPTTTSSSSSPMTSLMVDNFTTSLSMALGKKSFLIRDILAKKKTKNGFSWMFRHPSAPSHHHSGTNIIDHHHHQQQLLQNRMMLDWFLLADHRHQCQNAGMLEQDDDDDKEEEEEDVSHHLPTNNGTQLSFDYGNFLNATQRQHYLSPNMMMSNNNNTSTMMMMMKKMLMMVKTTNKKKKKKDRAHLDLDNESKRCNKTLRSSTTTTATDQKNMMQNFLNQMNQPLSLNASTTMMTTTTMATTTTTTATNNSDPTIISPSSSKFFSSCTSSSPSSSSSSSTSGFINSFASVLPKDISGPPPIIEKQQQHAIDITEDCYGVEDDDDGGSGDEDKDFGNKIYDESGQESNQQTVKQLETFQNLRAKLLYQNLCYYAIQQQLQNNVNNMPATKSVAEATTTAAAAAATTIYHHQSRSSFEDDVVERLNNHHHHHHMIESGRDKNEDGMLIKVLRFDQKPSITKLNHPPIATIPPLEAKTILIESKDDLKLPLKKATLSNDSKTNKKLNNRSKKSVNRTKLNQTKNIRPNNGKTSENRPSNGHNLPLVIVDIDGPIDENSIVDLEYGDDDDGNEEDGFRKFRRNRTVFTEIQLMGLERRFDSQKYLSTPDRADLARALGLTQLQVKTWYQNRRMKWKKQVMQNGCPYPPTKPKGRPKKDSIPTFGMEFTNSILCPILTAAAAVSATTTPINKIHHQNSF